MTSERVSTDLCRVTVTPVARIAIRPVLEQDVTEFVSQRAALSHGIAGPSDTDEYGPADWIPHCQAMLVRASVKHSHVDPGCLLNDSN
jgi:hypothetical protein